MEVTLLLMMIECFTSKNSSMKLKWLRTTTIKLTTNKNYLLTPPIFSIYISIDPHHVDPLHLRDLRDICHYFFHSGDDGSFGTENLVEYVTLMTLFNGELVRFGRAVSNYGLTASIYDVMLIMVVEFKRCCEGYSGSQGVNGGVGYAVVLGGDM
ncbi:uncharacterized protein LOC127742838 [Arachis duranensis]|uniref:Uncharacterized protein LOC127742838 n=1 Tax=Arachis duranensis TaxID=130453 RepID=A0A9C6WDQ6_ARADU|nr:uncharacterized protein LOC127742838 [Arachis duranensis]